MNLVELRAKSIGEYLVKTELTVRELAVVFGVSHTTVHLDLTKRLPKINPNLAETVRKVLNYHRAVRHLRGGESTKKTYAKRKVSNNGNME